MNVEGLVKGLVEFSGYVDCEVTGVSDDRSEFELTARKDNGNGVISGELIAIVNGDEDFFDISLIQLIDGSTNQYEDVKTVQFETI